MRVKNSCTGFPRPAAILAWFTVSAVGSRNSSLLNFLGQHCREEHPNALETNACLTGSVNEDLLCRIEYLLEENRVLRNQIQQRLLLTDHERSTFAEKAIALGKLMADTVTIVKPETILKWDHRLVAQKFDGSRFRKRHGRPC